MRKLLNGLPVKFGLLLTKAPTLLVDKTLGTSDLLPAALTERVKVSEATRVVVLWKESTLVGCSRT